jgi:hypothetical protein
LDDYRPAATYSLYGKTGEHISGLVLSPLQAYAAAKKGCWTMGIFEPLIERAHDKPPQPWHRRDVVALMLFVPLALWVLAVVLLMWGG